MFYGWWIVVLAFFTTAFTGATIWHGFTTFFDPLTREFGWSYTAISLAASMRGFEIGLLDVGIGFLLDRLGARRIVLAGSLLIATGYLLLSQTSSLPAFYASFIIVFIGSSGMSNVVFFAVISRWFHKRVGRAMGLVNAGVGFGGLALPGIVFLMERVGFRVTFVLFALGILLMGGISSYFIRSRPEDIGTGPDGIPSLAAVRNGANRHGFAVVHGDHTLREALSTPAFWLITMVSILMIFSSSMITTHVMPYLQNVGYSRQMASVIAMTIPLMSIIGRAGIGWISDMVSYRVMFLLLLAGQITGVFLFSFARTPFMIVPFLLVFGISFGGMVIIRPATLRNFFGRSIIGTIIGLSLGLTQLGSITGPFIAGLVFDRTGSYNLVWLINGSVLLAAIPLVLSLKRPRAGGAPVPEPVAGK